MTRITLLTGLLLLLWGCSFDLGLDAEPDTRLGQLGQLRFSGGGCSGSTTMAVGSRQTLRLEPIDGVLRGDLSVGSSQPSVIAASQTLAVDEIELRAHVEGNSLVAVYSAGDMYDSLPFQAEPAAALSFGAYRSVLSGGSLDVRVTEVFGACGNSDCPLIGHSFLGWRSEPADAFDLVLDDLGTAQFLALASGDLVGREPARGADLLRTSVTVVAHDQVSGLQATAITIPLDEGKESESLTLPATILTNQAVLIHVDALRVDAEAVPISRRDVRWTVSGSLIQEISQGHDGDPIGDLFLVGTESGTVDLEATVDLLGTSVAFTLTVAEGG